MDREKEENIWRRKIYFWWRRRQTEKKKEEIILRRKINSDATNRLGEYRALDLQLWNSGKNERSYQKYKIWLTMKFNRFCKQSPGVSLCPMLHSPPEKWDSGQVKKYINDNPCHLPWKLGYSEAIFTWILEKFVMSL